MSDPVALKLQPVSQAVARWRPTALDYVFAVLVLLGAGYAWQRFHDYMDGYEQAILGGTALATIGFAWHWKAMRWFLPVCALLALAATGLYQGDLARAGSSFWLKYLLASQSAVMWMCVLCLLATVVYWAALLRRSDTLGFVGSSLTWGAAGAALVSKLVRWYESYLIGIDVGHIPVSNLYEVFILFVLITALMYLYYEGRFQTRKLGAFVMLVVSAAVGFILWYAFSRQAHEIQPLIPALQSWWMKIHVPANFVGYGAFALAAMLGVAWLLAEPKPQSPQTRRLLFIAAVLIASVFGVFQYFAPVWFPDLQAGAGFIAKAGYSAALLCVVAACRGRLAAYLPAPALIDEVAYRAIALGFLFFTIATILGAMWAADAWGGYWSWDPKETWALIVWLNYAAWLHIRLVKGWRGELLAWWSVIGLYVTTFAFLGVNMFLSGLHSYGTL
ncbi:c-type cytochrome biogenesis protein CcsB [Chitinimonas lacunae]|uniref:C-type cytochrome biogenesis protein CcsB n=1 Tax=Chitinimonas lacunae TaxID=1963018 RepID=A0ABV8MTM0_9NEIS